MKLRSRLSILVCGLFILAQQAVALTIEVVYDPEKEGGYLLEVTKAALKRAGYEAVYNRNVPWARALQETLAGKYDMLVGAYHTPERAEKLAYSEPIGKVELCFFAISHRRIHYTTLEDLKPYRIGRVRGAAVSADFDKATYLQVDYATDLTQNIRKLLTGHIDLFIDKKTTALYLLNTQFDYTGDLVQALDPPLKVDNFYNVFPKSRPHQNQLLKDFNRGLLEIKKDGTYAAILKQYPRE